MFYKGREGSSERWEQGLVVSSGQLRLHVDLKLIGELRVWDSLLRDSSGVEGQEVRMGGVPTRTPRGGWEGREIVWT